MREHKNLVATLYLKNGKAVKSIDNLEEIEDMKNLIKLYNDSGIDKILIYDLSTEDEEHELNIHTIKELNRLLEIPLCAGGNINRLEDVKKLIYAGCKEVILNGSKHSTAALVKEASKRFGKEKIIISLKTVDYLFKNQNELSEHVHEILVMNQEILDSVENLTDTIYLVEQNELDMERLSALLKRENVRGICGEFINDSGTDIMKLKTLLSKEGIKMDNFDPSLKWEDLKKNSDGLIPVIVQDYKTNEVLMCAYMNEEAYHATLSCGKMTYYSRSRQELWMKGVTSGHIQYVKELTADCDFDTILAKVSQVGVACHTGKPSCFFNEIVKKEYIEKNPLKVFESVYQTIVDRKENPKEGSYTNYLFDKGIDKILKKVGEECTEIVIAAKNPDPEEIKYEVSDFLYHVMVLMVEKGVTWEDITQELAQR
ncbi:MAG: bifunctional phosphoribosyl-AMP cyclohydrolase/phosphoribosyl-ATP diphosphatase HisIE [Lachnospiraceae bacterium]|nr:bifunctional phosphoribosyl-AMP cyclohydrolase/phosphoribosyl-ATP diphosphatase HisIE [Lachnospiraceae bacterium]